MILLTGMSAGRVNLLQNDFAAGLPSPFAFLGLMASLAPALGVPRWQIGVLPIIHHLSISDGRTKGGQERDSSRVKSLEIVEDMRGSVSFSLLVDPGRQVDDELLGELVGRSRLAGGHIFSGRGGRDIRSVPVTPDGSAMNRIARGRVIAPIEGLPTARGHGMDLSCLADALYPLDRSAAPGWRVPVAAGYALLEDPSAVRPRRGVRDATLPHVFAEPIAGVAELISPRNARLTTLTADGLRRLMWRYSTAPAAAGHCGLVAAHPFYL